MILGIDTSAGQCSVALISGDRVWSKTDGMDRGHAEALFPMIETVLADAGVNYGELERIAVCTGPGSFTGVRIGVAAARGLALGLGVPAIGITRFEALAVSEHGASTVALPGRGGEIFVQDFYADGAPAGAPRIETGEAPDTLVDPVAIARLAVTRRTTARPAPVYMRPADAAPHREAPPPRLD